MDLCHCQKNVFPDLCPHRSNGSRYSVVARRNHINCYVRVYPTFETGVTGLLYLVHFCKTVLLTLLHVCIRPVSPDIYNNGSSLYKHPQTKVSFRRIVQPRVNTKAAACVWTDVNNLSQLSAATNISKMRRYEILGKQLTFCWHFFILCIPTWLLLLTRSKRQLVMVGRSSRAVSSNKVNVIWRS